MKILLVTFCIFISFAKAKRDKRLNEACTMDEDCMYQWSKCDPVQKKCICIEGIKEDAGVCKPDLFCPSFIVGNDVQVQKPGQPCYSIEVDRPDGFSEQVSNCSLNEFCFLHSYMRTADEKIQDFGHCCPLPDSDSKITLISGCPTVNKTAGSCPDDETGQAMCPLDTHECTADIPPNQKESCCPVVCLGSDDAIAVAGTGRCYNLFGQTEIDNKTRCDFTLQCPEKYHCVRNILDGPDSICQKDK